MGCRQVDRIGQHPLSRFTVFFESLGVLPVKGPFLDHGIDPEMGDASRIRYLNHRVPYGWAVAYQ